MFQVLFRICPKKKTLNGTREKYGEMIKRQKKIRQKWRKIREREWDGEDKAKWNKKPHEKSEEGN